MSQIASIKFSDCKEDMCWTNFMSTNIRFLIWYLLRLESKQFEAEADMLGSILPVNSFDMRNLTGYTFPPPPPPPPPSKRLITTQQMCLTDNQYLYSWDLQTGYDVRISRRNNIDHVHCKQISDLIWAFGRWEITLWFPLKFASRVDNVIGFIFWLNYKLMLLLSISNVQHD